jgi:hypothetical protein
MKNDAQKLRGNPTGQLVSVAAAAALIRAGEALSIAGDQRLLEQLPAGNWIAGTIPYFMAQDGGEMSRERLFVNRIPLLAGPAQIRRYDAEGLARICLDAPANGFSIIIIPAFSGVHSSFARGAPNYEEMFLKPLIGWVAGVHLDEIAVERALVFDGSTGSACDDCAVVMHVPLPDDCYGRVDILNLFTPGSGASLRFPETGFSAETCFVDGRPMYFSDYLLERKADTRFPLVADYCGAMVNVSIKGIDEGARRVDFYAPVFDDVEYRLADSIPDYVEAFAQVLPEDNAGVAFSCNCILNYLYSDLEGKRLTRMLGPMTFGEIAFQLLNQTLVYLRIEKT